MRRFKPGGNGGACAPEQDRSVRPKSCDASDLGAEQVESPFGDERRERAFVDVGGDARRRDLAERLLEAGSEPQPRLGVGIGERGGDDRGEPLQQGDRVRRRGRRREQGAEPAPDLVAEEHRDGDGAAAAERSAEFVVRASPGRVVRDDGGCCGPNRLGYGRTLIDLRL